MHRNLKSLLFVLPLLLALAARAQAPSGAVTQVREAAEERARTEINDLFRTLCPEQCVLVSVAARAEDEAVGGAVPGFETVTGGARLPTLRSLSADAVVDSQLPGAFRTQLKGLVAQRLKGVAPQVAVNLRSVAFPPRNAPHLEAPPRDMTPRAEPPPPAAAPLDPEAQAQALRQRAWERAADWAPLLAIVSLLALVLLVLGALLVLAVRRASQPVADPFAADAATWDAAGAQDAAGTAPEAAAAPAPTAGDFPVPRLRRLEKALREERAVRNAVVRQALAQGDTRTVALWTRELGDFLLEDLRGDGQLAQALGALAQELGRPGAAQDAGARAAGLVDLEGRVLAARLAQPQDAGEGAFHFLEGTRPERFSAAAQQLSPQAREVALRFAPAAHRTQALRELSAAQRRELALSLARQPELSASYVVTVAEELRQLMSEMAGGAAQVDRVLAEVLDTLPMAEQERLVERLRREGSVRLAGLLVTEANLVGAPVDVLSSALLKLPPARLVAYLGGAEADVRDALLAACPGTLQRELQEELALRGQSAPDDFLSARREVMASFKDELSRRGIGLDGVARGPGARS